jgi:hypothetical protein
MTIPHKGSRTVDVDGKPFRFLVKEKTVSGAFDNVKELSVTVQEEAERPGRPMQFTWPHGHAVTPEDVRTAVRGGIGAGWDPASKGGVFTLTSQE